MSAWTAVRPSVARVWHLLRLPRPGEIRKVAVAAAGLVGQAVALGLLTGPAEHYAQLALAAATAVGVYSVPNKAAKK